MWEDVDRWLEDRRWLGDLGLACILALVSLVIDYGLWDGQQVWVLWLFFSLSPLVIRSTWPKQALGLGVAIQLLNLLALSRPTVPLAVVPLLVYTAAAQLDRRWRMAALAAGLIGALLGPVRWWGADRASLPVVAMGVALCAVIVVVAYVTGERQRNRRERQQSELDRAAERAGFIATQEEQRTQVSLAGERARIARELHDIVAHSLSVVIVQAQGARAAVAAKPELAGPVLDTIADTSRAALAEMRTLVGVLRGGDDDTTSGYTPAQTLADLPDLVQTIRDAGVPVELEISGEQPPLLPGLELTVYRLVQESLTNVLKHGGPGVKATVELLFWDGLLQLDVIDDGRGAAAEPSSDGHGLIGMRERVSAMGGQVVAEPRPGGGFAVRARLPLPTS